MFGFGSNVKKWNQSLLEQNKARMRAAFAVSLDNYNDADIKEDVEHQDGKDVVVARRVLEPEDFKLVWAYHVDMETQTFNETNEFGGPVTVRQNSAIYTNLILGFSEKLLTLVVIKTDPDFETVGDMMVFGPGEFLKASRNWFSDQYTIFDKSKSTMDMLSVLVSSKRRLTFMVPAETDFSISNSAHDGIPILAYMHQHDELLEFQKFWRKFAAS